MLGIAAGVDQEDSYVGWFAGDDSTRAVLPKVVWPRTLGTTFGRTTRTVWMGFAGDDTTRAVFLMVVFKPNMLGILAGMD